MGRALGRLRGCPGLLLGGGGGGPALVRSREGAGRGGSGATETESGPRKHGQGGAALPAPGDARGRGPGVAGSEYPRSTFSGPDARGGGGGDSAGVWAAQVCGQLRFVTFGTPSCSNASRALPEPGRAKGRKGKERDREGSFGRPARR